MRAKSAGATDLLGIRSGDDVQDEMLVAGGNVPGVQIAPEGAEGKHGQGRGGTGDPPVLELILNKQEDGPFKGNPAQSEARRKAPRGGFQVKFQYMGVDSQRAKYVSTDRTIYLNLDHPQLVAARGSGTPEDPTFRRLAYEVAFSEYAIALATELAQQGHYMDLTDPIVDISETLNRLARKGAHLYALAAIG